MTETEEYEQQRQRKRKRNRIYDDECGTSFCAGPSAPIQTPLQRFKRTIFFAIIDNLLVALSKRQAAYEKLNCVFKNLVKMYLKDLELSLSEELVQFTELLKSRLSSNISKTDAQLNCSIIDCFQKIFWMFAFPTRRLRCGYVHP